MSATVINTDLSIPRQWFARKGFNNQFTITFTDSGAFDISEYTFYCDIRGFGKPTNLIELTQGDGITNGGLTGILTVQLSEDDSDSIPAQSYFFEIRYTVDGNHYGLIHGTLNLISEYNNENINQDLQFPANVGGNNITLEINLVGGSELRILTQTSTATLTPSPSYDCFEITAQAEALTIANPSPAYGNFEIFTVTVTDDGNAQDIIFGDKFRPFGSALPTETTAGKTMDIVCRYNATADKYDVKWSEEV